LFVAVPRKHINWTVKRITENNGKYLLLQKEVLYLELDGELK
jgi:hypothetical protein